MCWSILAATEANRVLLTFCGRGDILKDTGVERLSNILHNISNHSTYISVN